MNQAVDAVYEQGSFRVLSITELPLEEGQQVRLIIETSTQPPEDALDLAVRVYEGLSEEEIVEVERIAMDRRDFFSGEARQ